MVFRAAVAAPRTIGTVHMIIFWRDGFTTKPTYLTTSTSDSIVTITPAIIALGGFWPRWVSLLDR